MGALKLAISVGPRPGQPKEEMMREASSCDDAYIVAGLFEVVLHAQFSCMA
jgi:hypothetical protein